VDIFCRSTEGTASQAFFVLPAFQVRNQQVRRCRKHRFVKLGKGRSRVGSGCTPQAPQPSAMGETRSSLPLTWALARMSSRAFIAAACFGCCPTATGRVGRSPLPGSVRGASGVASGQSTVSCLLRVCAVGLEPHQRLLSVHSQKVLLYTVTCLYFI